MEPSIRLDMPEGHYSREKLMVDGLRANGAIRVLLVEDDEEIAAMLAETLRDHGFKVAIAPSAAGMDVLLSQEIMDIIVLDVMLPGEDGLSICKRLRSKSMIPIIMLTALGGEVDRVVGLEIGADDYVTKPFLSRELIARIRALLRRTQGDHSRGSSSSRVSAFKFAGWILEPFSRQLLNPQRIRISLTSAEFDLLMAFCRNPGRVLSREQLLELTHGGTAGPIARSIDVHVSRVRQKIDPVAPDISFIKTVRLGGYIFTPNVEAL